MNVGRDWLLANIALAAGLEQAESRESKKQVAREAADVKLAGANSGVGELFELRKLRVISEVSVQELTAELKTIKAQLARGLRRNLHCPRS